MLKVTYKVSNLAGSTREVQELLIGISLHEGDSNVLEKGLYGDLGIRDEGGRILYSQTLNPNDLKEFEKAVSNLKSLVISGLKIEKVETKIEEEKK